MKRDPNIVYVVVEVMSGIATGAFCFRTKGAAHAHAKELQRDRSPNDDDVQVFECALANGRGALGRHVP